MMRFDKGVSTIAGQIKGITIEIAGNTQPLNKALEGVNKKSRDLQGELRQVDRLLKLDPSNTTLLAQKQKLLAEAVQNSKEKLERLKTAQQQVNKQFAQGEIDEEQYRAFQREVAKAEQDLKKFETQLKDVGTTAKNSGIDIAGMGDKLKGIGQGMSLGVTAPLVAGFTAVTQGTKELRGDLATLSTNAQIAGQDMGAVNDALVKMQGVTGETDSNIEGLSNIMATGFKDEKLTELVDSLAGASIKFKDTMKFEGMADGLQETLATGAAIGPFAELLERSGVELEGFNEGLTAAIANGSEQEYVLETLAKTGLSQTYDAYRKNNEEMIKAEEANFRMQQAMAELGATLEPILTPIIEGITGLVNKFNEMDPAGQKIILIVAGIAAAIGPLLIVIGSIMTVLPVLGTAIGAISLPVVAVIAGIGALIAIGVALYKNWDEVKAKASVIWSSIKDFLSETLDKIKEKFSGVWNGIKDFLSTTFNGIKSTASNVWSSIKNFLSNTLNGIKEKFSGIWNGIKNFLGGIWEAIKSTASNVWNGLKGSLSNVWNSIKTTASTVWSNIKSAILSPIESAKETVLGIIGTIKDAFAKMKIAIPKPKLPHVSVSTKYKSLGSISIPYPDFSLSWYKTGGIFSRPSIIGVGEAGTEAVIPLDKMPGLIADALRDAVGGGQVATAGGITVQNMYVRNDQDIKLVARELYNLQQQNARGRGLR